MWIRKLTVNNCRLLEKDTIVFSPNCNLFVGENASGKTSLLESLSILSSGRSFRTSHINEVISHNKESVIIAAELCENEALIKIGIEKNQGKTKIRINHQDIYSQAELSSKLPITLVHPASIELITGPPSLRRSYIDWIAFYLFADFHVKWKKYQHILKQRNLCLKSTKHVYALDMWTEELVALQPDLTRYREEVVNLLKPRLNNIGSILLENKNIDIDLSTGFPKDTEINKNSLLEFYESRKENDLKFKRTTHGIHKADLKINIDNSPASESASRGQLKLLAVCLLLSQSDTIGSSSKGILLIDDLAAELDAINRSRLLQYLSTLDKQLIITTTKESEFKKIRHQLFHVKHGKISSHNSISETEE